MFNDEKFQGIVSMQKIGAFLTEQDVLNIQANIEEARKVGMERITMSLTLAEAEALLRLYDAYKNA